MENQISVLNIKLEEVPFYHREGVMGCDVVKGKGDVAFQGKIQNVYVVCDKDGLIKSVLAYFPSDIEVIDMAPDYNLAVKYYVRQHLVVYYNLQGEIIGAAEFMRNYPETFVQLQKGLKHAHFHTERWPLFKQFEEDQYKTVTEGDYFFKRYALDEAGTEQCTELLKVVDTDGSLGNCDFERKSIKCPASCALSEHFGDDKMQGNIYRLLEDGYDVLSEETYQKILKAIEQFGEDVQTAEKRLNESIEQNLLNVIK